MAVKRTTDAELGRFIRAGKRRAYRVDDNLYLSVAGKNDRASWVFRYMVDGKPKTMGLGSYDRDRPMVTLEEARDKAWKLRRELRVDGVDPLEARRSEGHAERMAKARQMTFKECAEQFFHDHRRSWKNDKHAAQFPAHMKTYVYPVFGERPVGDVDTELVLAVLRQKVQKGHETVPLWEALPETASRVRQKIEKVLSWATVDDRRQGENPARWRGHLEHRLPARAKLAKVQHHPALPYKDIAEFMALLRAHDGVSASALELTILTAARTGEVIGAKWGEFDLEAKVWTVPAERMKAGREHCVPLSDAAVAAVERLRPLAPETKDRRPDPDAYVFPGQSKGKPLSNMAMLKLLERMKRSELTVHGFRSTFRDWAAETTGFPHDVVEMALAHTISNKVEAAYRRGDLFKRRAELMDAWANACAAKTTDGKVTPLFAGAAA